jgi:hypothetical protein
MGHLLESREDSIDHWDHNQKDEGAKLTRFSLAKIGIIWSSIRTKTEMGWDIPHLFELTIQVFMLPFLNKLYLRATRHLWEDVILYKSPGNKEKNDRIRISLLYKLWRNNGSCQWLSVSANNKNDRHCVSWQKVTPPLKYSCQKKSNLNLMKPRDITTNKQEIQGTDEHIK